MHFLDLHILKTPINFFSGKDPGFACNGSRAKPLLTHSSEGLGGGRSEKAQYGILSIPTIFQFKNLKKAIFLMALYRNKGTV